VNRWPHLAGAIALVALVSCRSGPSAPDQSAFLKALETHRADVERHMREDPESPIPPDKRDALLPLRYFPPDPSFSIPAALKVEDERPVFEIPTSTGTLRRMQLVGVLQFTLRGAPRTLGAFVEEGQPIEQLFVPFADLTTGKETYSAGRYLDLHPTATGLYTIDFNRAYNPYCAYNQKYECPFPPPSNRLTVEVRAGEKAPGA
jgi:uncharacterized protein